MLSFVVKLFLQNSSSVPNCKTHVHYFRCLQYVLYLVSIDEPYIHTVFLHFMASSQSFQEVNLCRTDVTLQAGG